MDLQAHAATCLQSVHLVRSRLFCRQHSTSANKLTLIEVIAGWDNQVVFGFSPKRATYKVKPLPPPTLLLYLSSSSQPTYHKMKSIKGLGGVNRMLGSVRRRAHRKYEGCATGSLADPFAATAQPPQDNSPETTLSTPEENASRSVVRCLSLARWLKLTVLS